MSYIERNRAAWQAQALAALPGDKPQTRPRFEWTQYPGRGPGIEILGDLTGRTALELGCGNGDNTAALAQAGADCTGLDTAFAQIARARTRWPEAGIKWVWADATAYLRHDASSYDCIISVFGAIDLAPPHLLIPLVARRLAPGGNLAFATAAPNWLGRKATQLTGVDGIERPVVRWNMPPSMWITHCNTAGLILNRIIIVTSPEETPASYILIAKRPIP